MGKNKPTVEGGHVEYRGAKFTMEDAVMLGLIPPPQPVNVQEEVPGETATDQPGNTEPGDAIAKGSRGTRR